MSKYIEFEDALINLEGIHIIQKEDHSADFYIRLGFMYRNWSLHFNAKEARDAKFEEFKRIVLEQEEKQND